MDYKQWIEDLKDYAQKFFDDHKQKIFIGAAILAVLLLLGYCASARATGYEVIVPPVITPPAVVAPPAPPAPPAAPTEAAPGPGKESIMFKIVPLLLGALAIYMVWCIANEEDQKEYCVREETPVWPGP